MFDDKIELSKIILAFYAMSRKNNKQQRITSNMYCKLKKQRSDSLSFFLKGKKRPKSFGDKIRAIRTGSKLSENTKRKISSNHANVSGINNPMYGKTHTNKTKLLISISNTGKLIGNSNPMYGKTHTQSVKEFLSIHGKNKWTSEMKEKMIKTRIKNKEHLINGGIKNERTN